MPYIPRYMASIAEPEVYITENSPPFIELVANLYVGNEAAPVTGLHGMALFVTYPEGLTVPDAVTLDYEDNSFFGAGSSILAFSRDMNNYNLGRYDLALSRKNDAGASGYGKVARMSFIVSADIIEGVVTAILPILLGWEGCCS